MRTDSSARFYEMMSISVPDGTPEELIETAEAVSSYITAAGGEILRTSNDSPWGRRRLAYPIRHNSADLRDGFYTLHHFQIEPEGIESIEREIRLNERIIRHLLLVLDSEPVFVVEEEIVAEGVTTEGDEVAVVVETIETADGAESAEVIAVVVESADGAESVEPVAVVVEEPAAQIEEVAEPVTEAVEVAAAEEE